MVHHPADCPRYTVQVQIQYPLQEVLLRTESHNFSQYYESIFILFKTDLRISEFCGLTFRDIDFKKHSMGGFLSGFIGGYVGIPLLGGNLKTVSGCITLIIVAVMGMIGYFVEN